MTGCGGTIRVPPDIQETERQAQTLGPGDVFAVRVFGEEELSAQYRVDSDGSIDFPFLGRVEVSGTDPREVATRISEGLVAANVMVAPEVTVFVEESNSLRVSVVGAVARPGTFPAAPGLTVVQAISMAGGFTALASQNDTVLTRRVESGVRRFSVPAKRISEGRENDVPLQGGDIVYVPARVF